MKMGAIKTMARKRLGRSGKPEMKKMIMRTTHNESPTMMNVLTRLLN